MKTKKIANIWKLTNLLIGKKIGSLNQSLKLRPMMIVTTVIELETAQEIGMVTVTMIAATEIAEETICGTINAIVIEKGMAGTAIMVIVRGRTEIGTTGGEDEIYHY